MNKIFFCGVDWHCEDALKKFMYEKHETLTVGGFLLGQSFSDLKILAPIKKFVKKFILPSKRFFKGYPMASLFDIDKDDIIVVAIPDENHALKIYNKFMDFGYKKTYIYPKVYTYWDPVFENCKDDFLQNYCEAPKKLEDCVLEKLGFSVVDWCNLNCKACSVFSPLYEHTFPKLEDRISDLKKMKDKFSHIENFTLFGGEPFLNPELDKYIIQTRKILPNSRIYITTNGLLLLKQDKKIFEIIRENDIFLQITEYKAVSKMKNEIMECLNQNNIKYTFIGNDNRNAYKFNKFLTLSENSKYEHFCLAPSCTNIGNGKISRCPQLLHVDKFNEVFGTSLPTAGLIDLNSDISGKELLEELNKEVPLCKHCIKNPVDWEVCGKNPKLEDFAVND